MSLDIYLMTPDKCPHCGGVLANRCQELCSQNYTHNVIGMWREAGVYEALYRSEGHLASEYLDTLRKGIVDMKANPTKYEAMNPKNGWGSYETALPWLKHWLEACEQNPAATIHISA